MQAKPVVALSKGLVRYDTVIRSLELIEASVKEKIANSMRIVIKPDFFFTKQGMSTSVDAAKAVLDFILEFTNKKITIAEGLYNGAEIQRVFHKALFHELHENYGLKYVDLNKDDYVKIALGKNLTVKVAKTLLNSDFRISLAVPKLTSAKFSAATANIAIGGIISSGRLKGKNDKARLMLSKNYDSDVAELLKVIRPSLAVVDGFESVVNKKGLETNFCVASSDAVAADTVAAAAFGNKLKKRIKKQKYLDLCSRAGLGQSSLAKIAVVGERP